MSLAQNQLAQIPVRGMLDLMIQPNIIGCQVYASESTALIPGQAVKLVDSADGVPKVTAATAATDDIFGFVPYDQKDQDFPAGAAVDIAFFRGCVMYMTASAAIARGAQVMIVVSGSKVATVSSSQRIIGRALDKAAANNDLIRVLIDLPGATA